MHIAYVNARLREMVDLLRITEAVDDEVRKLKLHMTRGETHPEYYMMLGVWRSACDPNYVQEWTEEEKVIRDESSSYVLDMRDRLTTPDTFFRDQAAICGGGRPNFIVWSVQATADCLMSETLTCKPENCVQETEAEC
jgi:hypothetical protein